ncbi:ent-kaur-16-ene synthase, chloroplastic-like [Canna indica]|uniref:Ent-kaur-16-ene synthase, chloroplastic-like n=1 Tax=Canna indica TaxID=4628 RepID=A0AAQ3KZB6_9LILI|nr:ent-kaur-16-ene synthase, chloroplastic-like [Canna indica]
MDCAQYPNGSIERIKEQFQKIQLSPSSYDTAWIAMVPSPVSSKNPCFPDCVDWILENQHSDGSWGLHHSHPSLIKDGLSSTLACILALQRWKAGQKHVKQGLDYIESNSSHLMDEQLWSPIGYDIIFPGMLEHATSLGVNIPLDQSKIDTMLWKRDATLRELQGSDCEGRKAYLAYIGEGLVGDSKKWKEFMKYQRKNGSLFNSPSTTAAALMHQYDAKAHHYLHSLLSTFGGSVPTTYPLDVLTHLRTVDMVEKLGIARYFEDEIRSVLDRVYGCWLMNDEEIFLEPTTLAMAFRILRMKGYTVSPGNLYHMFRFNENMKCTIFVDKKNDGLYVINVDCLSQLSDENYFNNTLEGYLKDANAVSELYKASQVKILPNEECLDNLGSWSRMFLKQALATNQRLGNRVSLEEVEYVLKFPIWSNLDRLEHKRHIENFNPENLCVLKTSYLCDTVNKNDILRFAVDDFNTCQSIYREELQNLENWVKENKLDQLGFARQKQTYNYFSAAATLFSPEMSDARIFLAKNCILATVVDDFFDIGGSREELVNFISLVEKWDVNWENEACSEQVKIIFSSLFNTFNELGTKASALQKRSITHHLVDIRECEEGKLNSLSLRILHSHGSTSEEEAKQEMQRVIDSSRTELLGMVLQQDGSVVPRPCKDLFWMMCKILHLFYMKNDGYTSPKEMVGAVNAVVHEPVKVNK